MPTVASYQGNGSRSINNLTENDETDPAKRGNQVAEPSPEQFPDSQGARETPTEV